jgi:hypothetical protein
MKETIMQAVTKEAKTIAQYADDVQWRRRGSFQFKATRDEVAKHLKSLGIPTRKGSIRNQLMHPEYITDYVGSYETGFGNTDHRTHFAAVYTLEVLETP